MSAAVGLAVLGAACFVLAAVLQHRAVGVVSVPGGALGLRGMGALARRPGWLAGLAFAGAGAGLHATALVLAPISVVQPLGVLAVPFAVLLAAVRHGRAPGAGVLAGAVLAVAGVAGFVGFAAGAVVVGPVPDAAVPLAALLTACAVVVLAAVASVRSGAARCVGFAAAGAVAFGLVSALLRAVSLLVVDGPWNPAVLAAAATAAVALLVGGWSVQQAFACGPPEVVVACLTVIDPVVAVVLGVALFGEGLPDAPLPLMVGCAAAAAAGVGALARRRPDASAATPAQSRPPARPLDPTHPN